MWFWFVTPPHPQSAVALGYDNVCSVCSCVLNMAWDCWMVRCQVQFYDFEADSSTIYCVNFVVLGFGSQRWRSGYCVYFIVHLCYSVRLFCYFCWYIGDLLILPLLLRFYFTTVVTVVLCYAGILRWLLCSRYGDFDCSGNALCISI
jgi:hypothetical protein